MRRRSRRLMGPLGWYCRLHPELRKSKGEVMSAVLTLVCRATVLEPILRFNAYFPDINECRFMHLLPCAFLSFPLLHFRPQLFSYLIIFRFPLCTGIKKRNHKLLDYDSMRSKVKKLIDKPDKDPTKLPRAEREAELAKTAYEQLNEQLFTELPQLIDLRVPYLDPSFEALVKIQLRFCAEAYSRMAQVQQYLDADTREQYAQGHLDQRVEQVLGEIRDLSIAGTV